MSKRKKYTPRHRATPGPGVPTKALRTTLLCSSVAVAATGVTVGNGVLGSGGAAQDIRVVAADRADQFGCLDALYVSESNWRVHADNPTSSAYGIPQALTQTHDLPAGYMTSAEVQIRWGLGYIADRYGTPCSAGSFKQSHNWY